MKLLCHLHIYRSTFCITEVRYFHVTKRSLLPKILNERCNI